MELALSEIADVVSIETFAKSAAKDVGQQTLIKAAMWW